MRKLTTRRACQIMRETQGVTEKVHFGSDAFVVNGRIFATVWHDKNEINLIVDLDQQKKLLSIDGEAFTALENAWGRKGATCLHLELADTRDAVAALQAAYLSSAKPKATSKGRKIKTMD